MRRKGHPRRPRAITCCFFASLKTLLMLTKTIALRRNRRPRVSFSLAGFQVTLIGRFRVTAETERRGILTLATLNGMAARIPAAPDFAPTIARQTAPKGSQRSETPQPTQPPLTAATPAESPS